MDTTNARVHLLLQVILFLLHLLLYLVNISIVNGPIRKPVVRLKPDHFLNSSALAIELTDLALPLLVLALQRLDALVVRVVLHQVLALPLAAEAALAGLAAHRDLRALVDEVRLQGVEVVGGVASELALERAFELDLFLVAFRRFEVRNVVIVFECLDLRLFNDLLLLGCDLLFVVCLLLPLVLCLLLSLFRFALGLTRSGGRLLLTCFSLVLVVCR